MEHPTISVIDKVGPGVIAQLVEHLICIQEVSSSRLDNSIGDLSPYSSLTLNKYDECFLMKKWSFNSTPGYPELAGLWLESSLKMCKDRFSYPKTSFSSPN